MCICRVPDVMICKILIIKSMHNFHIFEYNGNKIYVPRGTT